MYYVIQNRLHLCFCVKIVETVDNFVNNFYLWVIGFTFINNLLLLPFYENFLFIIFISYVYCMPVRMLILLCLLSLTFETDWQLSNRLLIQSV